MFSEIVNPSWDLTACSSNAFTFWSAALLVVLFALAAAIVVLLGPSWLREARGLFVDEVR